MYISSFRPAHSALVFLGLGVFGVLMLRCSGSDEFTSEQKRKVAPPLQQVVFQGGANTSLQTTSRSDGSVAYHVLVRTDDTEALREEGLPVNSVSGGVVTARWTVEEIRTAAQLESVRTIEPSGQAETLQ